MCACSGSGLPGRLAIASLALALWAAPGFAQTPPAAEGKEPPHPLEGAFVSVRITGGFTPYRLVVYEVLWRGRVAVAGHYRGLVNYAEALHDMKLVPTEQFRSLLEGAATAGAFDLRDAPPAPKHSPTPLRYEVEVRRAGRHNSFTVTAPEAQAEPRYAEVVELVRRFVLAKVGELTFRNVFFEPGTYGYVNLTSVPVARVHIDGRDTGHETPLYGYELVAGPHEVRLVAVKERWERKHTLRVEPGMTTIVHFDLR